MTIIETTMNTFTLLQPNHLKRRVRTTIFKSTSSQRQRWILISTLVRRKKNYILIINKKIGPLRRQMWFLTIKSLNMKIIKNRTIIWIPEKLKRVMAKAQQGSCLLLNSLLPLSLIWWQMNLRDLFTGELLKKQ